MPRTRATPLGSIGGRLLDHLGTLALAIAGLASSVAGRGPVVRRADGVEAAASPAPWRRGTADARA